MRELTCRSLIVACRLSTLEHWVMNKRRSRPILSRGSLLGQAGRREKTSKAVGFRPRVEILEDRIAPSAGALDTTFDLDGKVTTAFGTASAFATRMATDINGRIVVVGSSNHDIVLARYNPDGSLDTSFDGDGKVITDLGSTDDAQSVAIDANGKIVVAGSSNFDIAVARYNQDGSL